MKKYPKCDIIITKIYLGGNKMEFNLELLEMQLINNQFQILAEPFSQINNVRNNIEIGINLGFATDEEDSNNVNLAVKYSVKFEQKDKETEKTVSYDNFEYIFIFEDKDKCLIDKISIDDITKDDNENLGNTLRTIAYPYIKEHIESQYKKANLEIKLPLILSPKKN